MSEEMNIELYLLYWMMETELQCMEGGVAG